MSVVEDGRPSVDDLMEPRPGPARRSTRRRLGTATLVVAAVLVVATAVGGVLLWRAAPSVQHLGDPFSQIPAGARAAVDPAAGRASNILVIGSDSRASGAPGDIGSDAADAADWTAGGQRSDVLMLVHLAADGRGVQVVSIPRDSWVPVPGYGDAKINAAFSYGGAPLAVQTVEQLTGVRVDHVVAIDFQGFARVTDALGGVRICVPREVSDAIATVPAGCSTMDGAQALDYVRQRKTLPGGDLDRSLRQQNWMRQVLSGLTQREVTHDPLLLARVARELAASVRTDDALGEAQIVSLALSHRSTTVDDVAFLQAPLATPATGTVGSQSVVNLDPVAGAELWEAVRSDDVGAWVAAHPDEQLADVVR